MRSYGVLLLWLLWLSGGFGTTVVAEPITETRSIRLDDQAGPSITANEAVYYLPASATLAFEQASAPGFNDRWQALGERTINLGQQSIGAWLRFEVHNPLAQPQERWLVIEPPTLDQVDVRVRHAATWGPVYSAGDALPFSVRPLPTRQLAYPITIAAGETATVYLRLRSLEFMVVPMRLETPAYYKAHEHKMQLLLSLFFGAMLAMLVYNACLYLFTRDRSYLWYVAYLFSVIGYELSLTGLGQRYLWPEFSGFSVRAYMLFVCLSFLFAAQFVRTFLRLTAYPGWMLWANNLILIYWALAAGVTLLEPELLRFLFPVSLAFLSSVLGFATTVTLWRKGSSSAKYLTLAWSVLTVSTLLLILALEGFVPHSPLLLNSQVIGFTLEFVLLSIALVERINQERIGRIQAQREALLASERLAAEREAHLQAQQEALEQQRQANEELERRVQERTQSLIKTNEELAAANAELVHINAVDPLCGVHNRRHFETYFTEEINRAKRSGTPVALLIIEIDLFKEINEAFGHPLGDKCIQALASLLSEYTKRAGDLTARLEGATFIMVLPGAVAAEAHALAERICYETSDMRIEYGSATVSFSASIGVVSWTPERGDDSFGFLQAASKALRLAQQEGRNRACLGER
ncbi:diguanylate cyclase [Pseudomonas duriflava]|uniref:diguanylate cyclase n=1 Tax=Pseudomonas duriflava TaxID=459528 RepID=A0A562PY44_9PSED|nr:diguanylate cyclase [Pseudomonas duriflava]TWI49318.1 diguanylate cyclase [Pseudomonas duriflava]